MADRFKDLVLNYTNINEYQEIYKIISKKKMIAGQFTWLKNQAKQGNSNAQDFLGEYHFHVTKNYKEAIIQYTLSAQQDNSYGQYNLGYLYEHGKGIKHDKGKAALLYEKSAEQGNHDALKRFSHGNYLEEYCDAKHIIFRLQSEKEIRRAINIPEVIIEIIASYQKN